MMRIITLGQNTLFYATAINQKVNENAEQSKGVIRIPNRDSVFLSKRGKKESLVQQLLNQKNLIQESKDALLKNSMENGYVDKSKLDEYDEQLKMLDEKIAKAMTEETEDIEENKDKVMTEKEYQMQKSTEIISLSSNMGQAKLILSAKEKIQGKIDVLKVEIKQDGQRVRESKFEQVAKMEGKVEELIGQTAEKVGQVNDTIVNNPENIEIEKESEQSPKGDEEIRAL